MRGRKAGSIVRFLLPLILVLLLTPPAQAQPDPSDLDTSQDFYKVNVIPQNGSAYIDYLGSATIPVLIEDVSPADRLGEGRPAHRVSLDAEVLGNNTQGWTASISPLQFYSQPGQTEQATLNIQAGATIEEPTVEVEIQAVYDPSTGAEQTTTNTSVLVVAKPFPSLNMLTGDLPDEFRPGDYQQVPVTVTNNNYYPDMVSFRVQGPSEWVVSPPSSVKLGPGETKTVFIDIRAPDNPWFKYTTSSKIVLVDAVSQTTGTSLVSTAVPISLSGSNVQEWVTPHMVLFAIGLATIAYRGRRRYKDHKLARGKPSFPGLPPGKEAKFAALKVRDPEEGERVEERLEVAYERRLEAWREAMDERKAKEGELREEFSEREEVLLEKREEPEQPSQERVREEQRELLEKKKRLLEKKREQLDEDADGAET